KVSRSLASRRMARARWGTRRVLLTRASLFAGDAVLLHFRLQGCGQHAGPRPGGSTQAELQDEYLGYCGAMLAIRTTLPHFSDSAAMKAANSWALSGIGTVPRSASRASIVGSASTAPISRSRRAMTAAGVPLGAPTPAQVLASYPGNASAIVGTSGSAS